MSGEVRATHHSKSTTFNKLQKIGLEMTMSSPSNSVTLPYLQLK